MYRDDELAWQLNSTWEEVFKEKLASGDIEEVRSAGKKLAEIAEKLESSNTRWKIATTVAFIVGFVVASIPYKSNDKGQNEPSHESTGSHERELTANEKLAHTIGFYIEQREKEWSVDPVEKQLKKLREIQWPSSPQESPYKNLNQLLTPEAQPNHPNGK